MAGCACSSVRRHGLLASVVVGLALGSVAVVAQTAADPQAAGDATVPQTRTEEIERARRDKHATLWPEKESPLVARANGLLDRGLAEGIQSGRGNNGWQFLLTGTRAAQGQTFGIGYRRSDLFHDALAARATVRGTLIGAFLVDGEVDINRLRRSDDTFIALYTKFERSPRMEFYGLGADSREEDRTRYLLNTFTTDVKAGYRFSPEFNAGVQVLGGRAHTGPTNGEDVPSIETIFNSTTAPGLFDDATFVAVGGFAGYDTRDVPRGPRRGGFYGINFNRFQDVSGGGTYTHSQMNLDGQQFLPYFNETRVLAIFVKARFAFTGREDRVVPFYLLPNLGGNFELRGFNQYRFADNNAFMAAIEHRWYVFSGLEMAAFVDAGKTSPEKGEATNFSNMNYSGGIGFRARIQDAIVLRFDIARSREGVRWIWSMSDVSRRVF